MWRVIPQHMEGRVCSSPEPQKLFRSLFTTQTLLCKLSFVNIIYKPALILSHSSLTVKKRKSWKEQQKRVKPGLMHIIKQLCSHKTSREIQVCFLNIQLLKTVGRTKYLSQKKVMSTNPAFTCLHTQLLRSWCSLGAFSACKTSHSVAFYETSYERLIYSDFSQENNGESQNFFQHILNISPATYILEL